VSDIVSIAWNEAEWRSTISQVQSPEARFVFHSGVQLPESSIPASSANSLLVLYDCRATIRRADLRQSLSRDENLLARRPDLEPAVVLAAELAQKHSGLAAQFETARHWIVALGLRVPVQFEELPGAGPAHDLAAPQLTMPRRVDAGWMRQFLVAREQSAGTSPTALAVSAGLYLMNDFFDESHHCSQSIEGIGDHTGDYWHAILHRREPDYGNARYWFRHVGRHPVFPMLAESLARRSSEPTMPNRVRELVSRNSWEPMRFVDLCEAAAADPELNRWCEWIQYEEMQLLLAYSVRAAHSARPLD